MRWLQPFLGELMFEKKLNLSIKGYLLSLINVLMTLNGYPILGIFFGLFAISFFIQALRVKQG